MDLYKSNTSVPFLITENRKSTIAQLVDFCFGSKYHESPALQQEFTSAELILSIGENSIKLLRSKNANYIMTSWENKLGNSYNLKVPLRNYDSPIFGENIYNFSDLMYYFMGLKTSLKVKKSKYEEGSPLIRLSFRDILWYCYLEQRRFDSSFFHLDSPVLVGKSRDVMRLIIGNYTPKFLNLNSDLKKLKENIKEKEIENNKIQEFLEKFNFKSKKEIQEKIREYTLKLKEEIENNNELNNDFLKSTNSFDYYRDKIKEVRENIIIIEEANDDLEKRISEQISLKSEYQSHRFNLEKKNVISDIFRKITFKICPLCHKPLSITKNTTDFCVLCKQELLIETEDDVEFEFYKKNLDNEIKEIDESIKLHTKKFELLKNELTVLKEQRTMIDNEFHQKLSSIETEHVNQLIIREKKITEFNDEIINLKKIRIIPETIEENVEKINVLESEVSKLKSEIEKEKKNLPDPTEFKKLIEKNYLNILIESKVPDFTDNDVVKFNLKDFIPKIYLDGGEIFYDFLNASSGGLVVLIKACFTLALHQTARLLNRPLPNFIIIDTMKNIGEPDKDILKSYFQTLYNLAVTDLKGTQIIIINQDYVPPQIDELDFYDLELTRKKPLIPSYKERV